MPWLNFDSPLKSKVSDFQIADIFVDFQALDPKFHLALEPKVLKLEGSSFGNMLSIYILKNRHSEMSQGTGLSTATLCSRAQCTPPP